MTWRTLNEGETPQPGDMAHHKHKDLDPREVVLADGVNGLVFLDVLGKTFGPFPSDNYEYERREE